MTENNLERYRSALYTVSSRLWEYLSTDCVITVKCTQNRDMLSFEKHELKMLINGSNLGNGYVSIYNCFCNHFDFR